MARTSRPVSYTHLDVYKRQSLKPGLVDAAENNYPSYESAHHYEVAKYYALTLSLIHI